jgi:Tol biopolymer transport system component
MSEYRSTLERELDRLQPPRIPFDELARRQDRKRRDERIRAGVLAIAIAMAMGWLGINAIRSAPPVPAVDPTPTPGESFRRIDGEVLRFTAVPREEPGDLVAMNPLTGKTRVLVEDLDLLYNARWSADGRWVAYDIPPASGGGLWVLNAEREPRQLTVVRPPYGNWTWSPTDPQLAMINGSTLTVLDASTGDQTDLGNVVGDVTSAPVWSPDGKQILFGARGGSLHSVDVRSGERSVFVSLPGEDLDSMDEIAWSPDGAHLAILNDLEPGGRRLYIMDADGSNLRVLVDDAVLGGGGEFAWSPEGTRLTYPSYSDLEAGIWTVSFDGSAPSLVVSRIVAYGPVWSPDGSQIAYETDRSHFVINADGTGDARPIDELTYLSWGDGSYFCGCYG